MRKQPPLKGKILEREAIGVPRRIHAKRMPKCSAAADPSRKGRGMAKQEPIENGFHRTGEHTLYTIIGRLIRKRLL